jgi:hypothetical protein
MRIALFPAPRGELDRGTTIRVRAGSRSFTFRNARASEFRGYLEQWRLLWRLGFPLKFRIAMISLLQYRMSLPPELYSAYAEMGATQQRAIL